MAKRTMNLVGHMCIGPTMHHAGSWRHPESDSENSLDPARYERLARIYEAGLFDALFLVDYLGITDWQQNARSGVLERGGQMTMLDPLQMLAVMARVTKHVGLAATFSTTYNHAYQIARQFSTLDHISNGRAGWNIVTSGQVVEARNLGLERPLDPVRRYDQADEVMAACNALWDSWDADAVVADKQRGLFVDPDKVHHVDYAGAMVKTQGAPTSPRSPQGRPVFMQAGASDRGRDFAARWAEIIFANRYDKAGMKAFHDDIKGRMADIGRSPEACAVLPAIAVIVADTEAEAQARAEYVDSFTTPEMGLGMVEVSVGRSLKGFPLDTPIADLPVGPSGPPARGVYDNMLAMRKDGRGLTLAEVAVRKATTWGLPRFVGTPASVVDQMQELFDERCCDGFIVAQPLSPGDLILFVEKIVPELQRRGLYRTAYTGRTFRENLKSALGGA